ncbi:glutathione S-transferase family protein [Pectobacterium aroidearum]|uniref:Glutathione S-transferase family protein n=1 Tax=Pectobacterium aroidearum TaxID=1201031 RepID=A0ABR5Z7P9_9GAMM|nr:MULTISPECIES: glutathione S-transferase family protein [Pectobacterium]MBA5197720.1 glutathione S-transferase family protein [Pectobacterium aroidearum]MBA5230322.1 glutathione S-transferase family protein [Pectobacterium aroidearum]MBA5230513.1 glutathione S-transferase family protein [Pectobacterium aroidearum]MBA5735720.1 glutathione S-transferase family protein [Pectobacterium aroidearum]UXK01890.1 glutathione S-transferase family protein [Pectobacterium aroidearum]
MYQLYIANKNYSSWSLRPWVLLKTLSIPFEEKLVAFAPGMAQPAFKAFSPTAKVPCLLDGETTVWDSLAITEYLAEQHPGVWPADAKTRAWARCAAAEMHSGFTALRNTCAMSCGVRVKMNEISPALSNDINRIGELWQEGLTRFGGPFLAGKQFSAVDAFFAPVVFRIKTYQLPVSPEAAAYCDHLLAQPAMQRWLQDALAETWREDEHEEEVKKAGEVIEDLRARA